MMTSFKTVNQTRGRRLLAALTALLMLNGAGCANLQLINWKSDKLPIADAQHPAIEVLAIWQAAEGPGLGGIPTRGFAGQIFFFTQDRAQPVAVDGKARIYVFDDHGTPEQQARPLRQFDFDHQSWAAHLQNSKLGPTYAVFIPYPREDFHQAVCSLRIRFTPQIGRSIYSQPSTIVLPGPPLPAETAQQTSPFDKLAKKLQSQAQLAKAWKNPSLSTDPNSGHQDPQLAAQRQPASVTTAATAPQASGAAVAFTPSVAYPSEQYPPEQPQGTRGNPIIQTAGTIPDVNGGAPPESLVYPATYSEMSSSPAPQPSGRFRLQAVGIAGPPPDSDDSDNADARVTDGQSAHSNHPLAD